MVASTSCIASWADLFVLGPYYALGPEVAGRSHQVDEVPSGVAVAPFALIGIEEVAVQEIANELVVELEGVESRGRRAGSDHRGAKSLGELVVGKPGLGGELRRYSVDEAGQGIRQVVGAGPAIQQRLLADRLEPLVGPDRCKLGDSVVAGL
jgi:hypothetical protein